MTTDQGSLKDSLKIFVENASLIDIIYNYVIENYSRKYSFKTKKQKYCARLIITELLYLAKTGLSYENYRGPVNRKTLNTHALFFAKHRIFENVYELMHKEYSKDNTSSRFKYQSTDTSYIMNINGKENIGRNKHNKNKNCYKLSIIVDSNGVPHSTSVVSGNKNDAKIGMKNINAINDNVNEINKNCKPYMLADKMYDTKEFRNNCINAKYRPIIDYNKRRTKDEKKIKKLTKNERKTYIKRIKVENRFCIFKKYRRVRLIYDSYLNTYISFVYLVQCCMIDKYIWKPKIKTKIEIPSYALEIISYA